MAEGETAVDVRARKADKAVAKMEQEKLLTSRERDRILTLHRMMCYRQGQLTMWYGNPGGKAWDRIRSEIGALAWAILDVLGDDG